VGDTVQILSSMFEAGTGEEDICKEGRLYLGLYGMGGLGKTTLCGAMCSYFQAEFRGRVYHVEVQGDGVSERVARLKHAIGQIFGFDNKIVDMITSESQVVDVAVGIVLLGSMHARESMKLLVSESLKIIYWITL
jgi:hypothetical protein